MTPEIGIRPAALSDRAALVGLLGQWLGRDVRERIRWLYERNPHGPALTWVAEHREAGLVACTSLFPRRFWVRSEYRLGAIGGDAFVLPSFRRRGIARALHEISRREMIKAGVEFMFGPPRPENLAALVKAGSVVVGRLHHLTLPLRPEGLPLLQREGLLSGSLRALLRPALALNRRVRRFRLRGQIVLSPPLDERFDDLWRAAGEGPVVRGVRDAAYLRWRYREHSAEPQTILALMEGGEVMGYAVLERHGAKMVIIDLLARRPAEIGHSLLAGVVEYAWEEGADALVTRWNLWGPAGALLLAHGFIPGRSALSYQVLTRLLHPPSALFERRLWQLSYGDEDLERLDFIRA